MNKYLDKIEKINHQVDVSVFYKIDRLWSPILRKIYKKVESSLRKTTEPKLNLSLYYKVRHSLKFKE